MAAITPDIPELRHVPASARPLVYMRALGAAVRSPWTWVYGFAAFALLMAAGAIQGTLLFGATGGVVAGSAGAAVALWLFLKMILPWRARRFVPSALQQMDPAQLEALKRADDDVRRMVAEYERRESGGHFPNS